jgi:transposase
VAKVFEVRDELWAVVEPLMPPVEIPEKQGAQAGP